MRFIGLDVHLDFCEIAICEDGKVRSAGRVPSSPEGIETLARSLAAEDQVALEATGNALQIARLLEPHVARVVVAPDEGAVGDYDGEGQDRPFGRAEARSSVGGWAFDWVLAAGRGNSFVASVAESPRAAGPAANAF